MSNPVRRTIATVCLSGMLTDKLDAAAAAGFDGIELFENDLVNSQLSPEQIRSRCADLGLTIDLYQPLRNFEAVPHELHQANLRRAERKFELMQRLGTETILVCSTLDPHAIDDNDLAAEQLRTLAEHAGEHGVRIAYEALAWGRFVNTWEHSWRIVHQADHPNLGLCLDSFHILSRDPQPDGLATIDPDKLFFLQLADAPQLDMSLLQWSRHHRLFPGQGTFDLPRFVDQALAAGYTGPLSLEIFNDVFRQADPDLTAIDGIRSMITLEEAVETREPRAPYSLAVDPPPSSPELSGWSFIELTVDDASEPTLTTTLDTLGFTHTGDHTFKPVQLWQQGDCNLVVNNTHSSSGPTGDTDIAGIAIESQAPEQATRRATAMHAAHVPDEQSRTDANLHTIQAPDGKHVFFCHTATNDPASWRRDFTPTGNQESTGSLLTHIEHLAVAQPFDHFAQSLLFYHSILDLKPLTSAEYAAPFGLVRSQAVENNTGHIRIAMHSALLRRGGWAPATPDPEHISFATQDIFHAARTMRDRGAPILSIPDNYYDDLDARFALPPDVLDNLRELNILYDRDEHGELFHFCTQLLGTRVFFEITQRTGHYQGYGAANAPIRMAAHRQARLAHETPTNRAPNPDENVSYYRDGSAG